MTENNYTKSELDYYEGCPQCSADHLETSDCVAVYKDGSKWCFKGAHSLPSTSGVSPTFPLDCKLVPIKPHNQFIEGEYQTLTQRSIRKDTCEKYHYQVGSYIGKPCQIASSFKNGSIVFQHLRFYPKDFLAIGNSDETTLWGSHIWGKGKRIVITEGELDALSISQAFDNNWPAVSLPYGISAAEKCIKRSLEYLANFDEIVLMFDMDEVGQAATIKCANLLPIGRVYIGHLELHDANDMLMAGKIDDIRKAVWNATPYRPDGIMDGKQIWEMMITKEPISKTTYPFPIINERTRGIKSGEIVLIISGTSMGKSSFSRQLSYKLIKEKRKVGYFGLEETPKDTGNLILGLELKERIHITHDHDLEDFVQTKKEIYDEEISPYLCSYKFMGADESLLDQIRFMVKGMDCQYIVIDHINLAVANGEMGQKWEIIERFMSDLRKLVSECGFTCFVVSQLTSPDGKTSFEDGAMIQLNHIRGCKGLAHAANTVLAITGDSKELTRQFHVLKTRTSGRVGEADVVTYNEETGLLELPGRLINEDIQ